MIAKEGVPAPVAGMFCQAVVAAVLLYGSESWVLPDAQLARLEGFHMECARRLTGMRPRKRRDKWVYLKSADVLRAARLQPLRYYIQKQRAAVAKAIATRLVLEECRGAARLRGTPVRDTWWEQDLTPSSEPERGDAGMPGLGAFTRAPGKGWLFPLGHCHPQPHQTSTSLEDQQAAQRTQWEARDLDAEAVLDGMWDAAHLPLDQPYRWHETRKLTRGGSSALSLFQ